MKTNSFTLANFKAFGPAAQEIPLKPITLVFGPNSTGKSSLLHGLLWQREALIRGHLDIHRPTDVPEVNLGGYAQVVHRHQSANRPLIGWTIPGNEITPGLGGWHQMESFRLEMTVHELGGKIGPSSLSILSPEGPFFRATRKDRTHWKVDFLDWQNSALKAVLTAGGTPTSNQINELSAEDPASCIILQFRDLLPESVEAVKGRSEWIYTEALPKVFRALFDAFHRTVTPLLRELAYVPPLRTLPERDFDPLSAGGIWHALATQPEARKRLNIWLSHEDEQDLSRREKHARFRIPYHVEVIQYLREDAVAQEFPNILRESLADWLGNTGSEELDNALSDARHRWIEDVDRVHYARKCPQFWNALVENMRCALEDQPPHDVEDWNALDPEEQLNRAEQLAEDIYANDPDYWPDRLEPFICFLKEDEETQEFMSRHLDESIASYRLLKRSADHSTKSRAAMVLRDLRTEIALSFQDVGVGISQVIPVVAHAMVFQDTLIAIEQPEIHIHPALQSELADVFIESALGENKNSFLLETHSEHLILRILRRIRETTRNTLPEGVLPIRPSDVAVLYVKPGENGAEVRELRINDQGRFIDEWPDGFFEGRLEELI